MCSYSPFLSLPLVLIFLPYEPFKQMNCINLLVPNVTSVEEPWEQFRFLLVYFCFFARSAVCMQPEECKGLPSCKHLQGCFSFNWVKSVKKLQHEYFYYYFSTAATLYLVQDFGIKSREPSILARGLLITFKQNPQKVRRDYGHRNSGREGPCIHEDHLGTTSEKENDFTWTGCKNCRSHRGPR